MAMTNAQKQRAMRQEELRNFLSNQKLIEKVVDNIEEIESLELPDDGEYKDLAAMQFRLNVLKTSNDQRLKLISKYLPDLKSTELTGEGGGDLTIKVVRFGNNDTEQLEA